MRANLITPASFNRQMISWQIHEDSAIKRGTAEAAEEACPEIVLYSTLGTMYPLNEE